MDSKIFFNCGNEKLVIKFEDQVPTLTIGDDKCITISNIGRKAFIHDNSTDNWKVCFEFTEFAEKKEMVVKFKNIPKSLKFIPFIVSFKADFMIEGVYE